MAGPGGKEVGRLSIRVLPNTTQFRGDLERLIKRVESSMFVNLAVKANTREAQLEIDKFRKEQSGRSVSIGVDVQALIAKAQLALLTRARFVSLVVRVNQASINRAKTALASLSGYRLVTSILEDVNRALSKLDLNLPKITRMALGIANLTSVILASSVGLVTLAGDLAKVGNTAFILPAAFSGLAVGITTLALALKDSKKELAELGPAMNALQDSISTKFWDKAKDPIIEFMNSILPDLRRGFANTATALGNQTAALARAFQATFGGGVLAAMFDRLTETMDIVTTGAQAFAEAITTIGTVGSNYLPRLAEWVVKITEQFNNWIQIIAASGELDQFIEEGITNFKLLGTSIADIVRIFKAIDSAATAAGAGGLATFASTMDKAATAMNGATFQTALTTIIIGVNKGLDGIGEGFAKIGDMLAVLAPNIGGALADAGEALGGLMGAIADAMTQPVFRDGLTNFFQGISDGVAALEPAMAPLWALLGTLGTTLGVAAANFGPLLAVLKEEFAPVIESVIEAITPLIPLLAGGLTSAIEAVGPIFQALGDFISGNEGFVQGLILGIIALVVAIKTVSFVRMILGLAQVTAAMVATKLETARLMAMYAGDFIKKMALATAAIAVQTANWVKNTAILIAQKVAMVAGAIATGIATAAQVALNLALTLNPIGLIIAAIVALIVAIVLFFTQTELGKSIWTEFVSFLTDLWNGIVEVAGIVFKALGDFFVAVWDGIVAGVEWFVGFVLDLFFTFNPLGIIIANWDAIVAFFGDVWDNIIKFVTDGIAWIVDLFMNWHPLGIIIANWDLIVAYFGEVWTNIVKFVTDGIAWVMELIVNMGKTISAIWEGIWAAVVGTVSGAWNGVKGFISNIVDGIVELIGTIGSNLAKIPTIVSDAFATAGTWLLDAGKSIIQGLIDGIMAMVDGARNAAKGIMDAIAGFFPNSPAKEGPFSGKGWTLYSGQAMGEGFADGMESRIDKVRSSALAMMSAASVVGSIDLATASTTRANLVGATTAGDQITIQGSVGYDPQAIAEEIDKKKRQAQILAGIRTVSVA